MYCNQYVLALGLAKHFRKAVQAKHFRKAVQDDPNHTLLRTMHAFDAISACQQLRWS